MESFRFNHQFSKIICTLNHVSQISFLLYQKFYLYFFTMLFLDRSDPLLYGIYHFIIVPFLLPANLDLPLT